MPGVRMRFLPRFSTLLIVSAESPGFAMKNLLIGIDFPAAGPLPHDVPEEFRRAAGANTLYFPVASWYRNGASRVTGLVANVVYVGLGKLWTGTTPVSPEKT